MVLVWVEGRGRRRGDWGDVGRAVCLFWVVVVFCLVMIFGLVITTARDVCGVVPSRGYWDLFLLCDHHGEDSDMEIAGWTGTIMFS